LNTNLFTDVGGKRRVYDLNKFERHVPSCSSSHEMSGSGGSRFWIVFGIIGSFAT
jgi:hypothetical protein